MQGSFYNLDAIHKIMMYEAPYTLSSNILQIIQCLGKDIGVLNEPVCEKRSGVNKQKRHHNNRKMDEPWEAQPLLKTTVLEIARDGFEKQLNDIRNYLNKLSTKTYDGLKSKIIDNIHEIMRDDTSSENSTKIVEFIFEIASSNKFYSELYAQLYKELIEHFPVFDNMIEPFLQKYMESIHCIQIVDQNVDYDGFCENNKKNEKRKATSMFIVNLLKNEVIPSERVMSIITSLQKDVYDYIEIEGKTGEVEEITENLFILITTIACALKTETIWTTEIDPNVRQISAYKSKDKKSLSSRAIFKYMDIVEKFL